MEGMNIEAYNLCKSGYKTHSFMKPIQIQSLDNWTKVQPNQGAEIVYSVQRTEEGFTLYKGDGTTGGKSLLIATKPGKFSSQANLVLEDACVQVEIARPKDVWRGSMTRTFNYDSKEYKWVVESPLQHAKLINCTTNETVAEFNHHLFQRYSQGNLLIHKAQELDDEFRTFIVATGYSMYLEDAHRSRSFWALILLG